MNFNANDYIKPENIIQKKTKGTHSSTQKKMNDRGISYIRGRYTIEPSPFITYANTRTVSKDNEEGVWFYNYRQNRYDLLPETLYKKIFFQLICEPDKSWWNVSMEKAYLPYFTNQLSSFNSTGTEEGVLQFNNGIIDFTSNFYQFKDPSPDYFCHFHIPYSYDQEAECPQFKAFLRDIFENDQERINLIQEIMGATLYYCKCMPKLVVFLGEGSNGKSVLASIIKSMLGEKNVSSITLDQLGGNRFAKQNLDKKLLNISSETNPNKVYDTADLKALTGVDSVEIEKKYQNSYTTEIHAKYILLANEMIRTKDYSNGFYRRLMIIPFNQKYEELVPGEEMEDGKKYQDIFLEDDLKTELPGILNFALEGLARLIKNNYTFTESKACTKALEHYRNNGRIIEAFMNEAIEVTDEDNDKILSSTLYPEFNDYCINNNYIKQMKKYTRQRFLQEFDEIINSMPNNVRKVKRKSGYYYIGLTFKS